MAALEEFLMVLRKWLFGRAQFGRPAIRNFCEVRISRCTKRCNDLGQWIAEIFVVALAEAVALHDDVAAKGFFSGKKRGESGTLLQIQEWTRRRIAGFRQLRCDLVPLDCTYAVLDGWIHSTARVSRLDGGHLSELLREIVRRPACPKFVSKAWRRTRASGASSTASRGRLVGPNCPVRGECFCSRECRKNDTSTRNFSTCRSRLTSECRTKRDAHKTPHQELCGYRPP